MSLSNIPNGYNLVSEDKNDNNRIDDTREDTSQLTVIANYLEDSKNKIIFFKNRVRKKNNTKLNNNLNFNIRQFEEKEIILNIDFEKKILKFEKYIKESKSLPLKFIIDGTEKNITEDDRKALQMEEKLLNIYKKLRKIRKVIFKKNEYKINEEKNRKEVCKVLAENCKNFYDYALLEKREKFTIFDFRRSFLESKEFYWKIKKKTYNLNDFVVVKDNLQKIYQETNNMSQFFKESKDVDEKLKVVDSNHFIELLNDGLPAELKNMKSIEELSNLDTPELNEMEKRDFFKFMY